MVEAGGSSPRSRGTHWSPRRERGSRSAHPRVRGEHLPQTDWISCKFGSSPRSRGTPRCRRRRSLRARLIPAFAGNTPASSCSTSAGPAHPRVRGEHWRCTSRYSRPRGSSPRSRGTRGTRRSTGHRRRLIPAFAGNTHQSRRVSAAIPAHPRVRGEHNGYHNRGVTAPGSSPRSRGTHRRGPGRAGRARLIPAFAGNTRCAIPPCTGRAAHPRVRGEHGLFLTWTLPSRGSSPRSRGTRGGRGGRRARLRLIPAFAGNTPDRQRRQDCPTAHPRVRGEHESRSASRISRLGSSPRSRGTRLFHPRDQFFPRLIPAFAGNTLVSALYDAGHPAHPRVRGEHLPRTRSLISAPGSSPRSRGTLRFVRLGLLRRRLIPAFAGNTIRRQSRRDCETAHPRVRGEHSSLSAGDLAESGSSPRSRGTRQRGYLVTASIPAHPRVRGEHVS